MSNRVLQSIHARLLIGLLLPLTLVAGLVAVETFYSSQKVSDQLSDQTLLAIMLAISENVIASNGDLVAEDILEVLTENLGDQLFYHVAGPGNAFVTGYGGVPELPKGVVLKGGKPFFYNGVYQDDPVRVVAIRQLLTQREHNGWTTITTWQRISERRELALELFGSSLLRLLVMVLSAGVIVWVAVSRGLQPLENLRQAIEIRSPDDLTPIKRFVPLEVRGIVASVNALFERVGRARKVRERFIGDAAHQLRNPIAALKTQAEIAADASTVEEARERAASLVQITNDTALLVEKMLISARANTGELQTTETFDLAEVITKAARFCAPGALVKQQEFSLSVDQGKYPFCGDKMLLREAVTNLIDNAIKHNASNRHIEVGLVRSADHYRVSVADNGVPVDSARLKELLRPFSTGTTASSGSGLGLSIASDISKLHGGQLTVQPMAGEFIKQFVLTLPVSQAAV